MMAMFLIMDYFKHFALPIIAITLSGFAALTLLTKHSFQEGEQQALCDYCTSQRLNRIHDSRQTCLSQCHADCDPAAFQPHLWAFFSPAQS